MIEVKEKVGAKFTTITELSRNVESYVGRTLRLRCLCEVNAFLKDRLEFTSSTGRFESVYSKGRFDASTGEIKGGLFLHMKFESDNKGSEVRLISTRIEALQEDSSEWILLYQGEKWDELPQKGALL